MKKSVILIFLFVLILSAPISGSDRVDMIVLLDNSISVLPYYDEIQNSLLRRIVSEHLAPGDSFSLITFSDTPEVEVSREIKNRSDIDNILAYAALLQPMGSHTDLIMALRFLYKYTLDLPLNNRKKIVILTDGIHDPPEGSPYFSRSNGEVQAEIQKAADDIRRQGWDVSIVEIEDKPALPGFQTEIVAEANQADARQTDATQADATQADAKQTDARQTDARQTDARQADARQTDARQTDAKQTDARQTDAKQTDARQADAKQADARQADAKQADVAANKDDTKTPAVDEVQKNGVNVIETVAESIGSTPNVFDTNEKDMAGIALGTPQVSVPDHLGTSAGVLNVPLTIKNRANKTLMFSLSKVISSGSDVLKRKIAVEIPSGGTKELNIELNLPDELPEGEQQMQIKLQLTDGERIQPEFLMLNFRYEIRRGIAGGFDRFFDWKIITAVIAVIFAFLVILILKKTVRTEHHTAGPRRVSEDKVTDSPLPREYEPRKVPSAQDIPAAPVHHAEDLAVMSMTNPDSSDDTHIIKKNRPIHMFVFGQNTKSGVSNVQWLGLKKRRVIGSSANAFFRIFFVKVPSVLAEIECTGSDFIFYPKAEEYFPELSGTLSPCLNRKIKVVTPDEKIFFIEFRQWVSKLEKLNRLLNMTRTPGKPDLEF